MINFRYHLVSLIAVFLALALGIAMGATVISQGIVDTLEQRIDDVEANADARSAENDELRGEVARMEEYMRATAPYVVAGRLEGAAVLVVAARGVSADAVERTVELCQTAGADAPGVVWLEESWGLGDADQAAEMAALLGRPADLPRRVLRREAWSALARRLADGPPPYAGSDEPAVATDGRDLLAALIDAGFVAYESVGEDTDASDLPTVNARVLLIDGTGAAIPPDDVVARGTPALLRANFSVVVVAEVFQDQQDGPERGARVQPVRDDEVLADLASTVDDLDLEEGRITAALVLADGGLAGHYGYGTGARAGVPAFAS